MLSEKELQIYEDLDDVSRDLALLSKRVARIADRICSKEHTAQSTNDKSAQTPDNVKDFIAANEYDSSFYDTVENWLEDETNLGPCQRSGAVRRLVERLKGQK